MLGNNYEPYSLPAVQENVGVDQVKEPTSITVAMIQ